MSNKPRFGLCPGCNGEPSQMVMNQYNEPMALCDECETFWPVAPILAKHWPEGIPADWSRNRLLLEGRRRVTPVNYPSVQGIPSWDHPPGRRDYR